MNLPLFRLFALIILVFGLSQCNIPKKVNEEVLPVEAVKTAGDTLRFASFNVSMFRNTEGVLLNELGNSESPPGCHRTYGI